MGRKYFRSGTPQPLFGWAARRWRKCWRAGVMRWSCHTACGPSVTQTFESLTMIPPPISIGRDRFTCQDLQAKRPCSQAARVPTVQRAAAGDFGNHRATQPAAIRGLVAAQSRRPLKAPQFRHRQPALQASRAMPIAANSLRPFAPPAADEVVVTGWAF